MKKILSIFLVIGTLLLCQGFAFADQTSTTPNVVVQPLTNLNFTALQNGLRGDYYDGRDFTTYESFRIDNSIDFSWTGTKVPILGVKHDNFSVRWSGYIVPSYSEVYTFTTKADDGVRLYINGNLIINDWTTHGEKEQKASVQLVGGQPYSIKMEYFQYNGPSAVKLYWSSNSQRKEIISRAHLYTPSIQTANKGTGTGLLGTYYDDATLNKLSKNKIDKTINFEWNYRAGQTHTPFSIRWTGKVQPLYTELYTFRTLSDDGIRVWVNGQLIIDSWHDGSDMQNQGNIQLQAGQQYDIKVEYYENGKWPAEVKLYWSSPSQPLEIVPQSQLYPPAPPATGTGTGLKAEYYADKTLTNLKVTKLDTDINFDWGNRGLPVDGVAHDNFSVRWSGKIQPLYTESYNLKTIADDGIRLWINGKLIIDDWTTHSAKVDNAKIDLQAGQMYDIKIEYYQEDGLSRAELYWSSDRQKSEIIPQKQLYNN